MIEIENSLAATLCKRFEQEGLACPANLRKGLFTVRALDNIDHNTTSTTAKGALHGTAMSVFQFPTLSNPGVCSEPIVIVSGDSHKFSLPDQYTCVPAVSCKTDQLHVSEYFDPDSISSYLDNAKAGEAGWVKQGIELLAKNKLSSKEYIFLFKRLRKCSPTSLLTKLTSRIIKMWWSSRTDRKSICFS